MKPSFFIVLTVILFVALACGSNDAAESTHSASPITPTIASSEISKNGASPILEFTRSISTTTPLPTKVISACQNISASWSVTPPAEWSPDFVAVLPIQTAKNRSPEEIAGALFCQYLDHFRSPEAAISQRLRDFQVDEILSDERLEHLRNEFQVDFVAWVTFSVLPVQTAQSGWLVGNGEISDDGWIRNKQLIVGFFKHDEVYEMKIIGTGP